MNKKVIAIILLVALAVAPAMAAVKNPLSSYSGATKKDSLALGVNLGTHTGLAVKYGMGKFDLIGDLSYKFGSTSVIGADVGAMYHVYDVKIKGDLGTTKATFPVTVGGMADVGLVLGDKSALFVAAYVPVAIDYTFKDVPLTVYLRVAPGLSVLPSLTFDINAGLGVLYTF